MSKYFIDVLSMQYKTSNNLPTNKPRKNIFGAVCESSSNGNRALVAYHWRKVCYFQNSIFSCFVIDFIL